MSTKANRRRRHYRRVEFEVEDRHGVPIATLIVTYRGRDKAVQQRAQVVIQGNECRLEPVILTGSIRQQLAADVVFQQQRIAAGAGLLVLRNPVMVQRLKNRRPPYAL